MRAIAITAAWIAVIGGSLAHADRRAPSTQDVRFQPGDPRSIYVASTFGLLISHDDGCSFRWICAQRIGNDGAFDPKYRVAADGAIFATTASGLRVSRDGGCTFAVATSELPRGAAGRIADLWIDAIELGPTGEVWVATADAGKPSDIYRSTDNGVTFASRGLRSPAIWWKSVAIAATRPQRVYATGYQVAGDSPSAQFEITDDGGETWRASPLAGVAFGATPMVYAVAVDPWDPDLVFMTSAGAHPPSGDRLYRSIDGGTAWTEVLATAGAITDVAITHTGMLVTTRGGGSYRSLDAGATFAAFTQPQLACVGQRDDGAIFGCAANGAPDYEAVARARGASWDKVLQFGELAGPLACPGQRDVCGPLPPELGASNPPRCEAPPPRTPPSKPRPPEVPGALIVAGAVAVLVGLAVLRRKRKKACCS